MCIIIGVVCGMLGVVVCVCCVVCVVFLWREVVMIFVYLILSLLGDIVVCIEDDVLIGLYFVG